MKKTLKWRIAQKAELKWWQRYLKDKDVDGYLDWKRAYWTDLVAPIADRIGLDTAEHILDAGCGPAGIFTILDPLKGKRIDAFDPLINSYEESLSHFSREAYPRVNFQNCGLEAFQQPSEAYDLSFCMNAINHVASIDQAYDVLANSVRPGGWVVVTIDAHNHAAFKHLFRMVPGDILHPHQYDLAEYEAKLTERGFKTDPPIKIKGAFFFDHYLQLGQKI